MNKIEQQLALNELEGILIGCEAILKAEITKQTYTNHKGTKVTRYYDTDKGIYVPSPEGGGGGSGSSKGGDSSKKDDEPSGFLSQAKKVFSDAIGGVQDALESIRKQPEPTPEEVMKEHMDNLSKDIGDALAQVDAGTAIEREKIQDGLEDVASGASDASSHIGKTMGQLAKKIGAELKGIGEDIGKDLKLRTENTAAYVAGAIVAAWEVRDMNDDNLNKLTNLSNQMKSVDETAKAQIEDNKKLIKEAEKVAELYAQKKVSDAQKSLEKIGKNITDLFSDKEIEEGSEDVKKVVIEVMNKGEDPAAALQKLQSHTFRRVTAVKVAADARFVYHDVRSRVDQGASKAKANFDRATSKVGQIGK